MMYEGLLGKEVYLIFTEDDFEISEIDFATSWVEVQTILRDRDIMVDPCRVLHGFLTSAKFLPTSLRNKTAWVLMVDPFDMTRAVIVESAAAQLNTLVYELENLMDGGSVAVVAFDVGPENIFILYGYEAKVIFTVDEESMDEEAIETCKQIADETIVVAKSLGDLNLASSK